MMVLVTSFDGIVDRLTPRGYRQRPEPWNLHETTYGVEYGKLVLAGPVGERLRNVHVRVADGGNVRYALLFRDYLRADVEARLAWGAFKSRLAESVSELAPYGQIKAAAQPLLMRAAEDWAAGTGWS